VSDKLPQERRWRGWREGLLSESRVVEKCSYCDFAVSAPVGEAHAAFQAHECDRPQSTGTRSSVSNHKAVTGGASGVRRIR